MEYAKRHKIPVVGLNLQRKIVSQIFREGGTDGLSKETKVTLPDDRDLDMDGYVERLSQTHSAHITGSHASGSFAGFIQSQGLWDETMASNIVSFLQKNPGKKMIVLAGSQHTRKDSGIPPRVKRRMEISQASVLNIYDENRPKNLQEVADYYFLATSSLKMAGNSQGIQTRKIMAYISLLNSSPMEEQRQPFHRSTQLLINWPQMTLSTSANPTHLYPTTCCSFV